MDRQELTILATELAVACAKFNPAVSGESTLERDEILRKARQIMLGVTSPVHFTWTQIANMYMLTSLRTSIHLGLLQRMPNNGSISLEQLARRSGVQASLLERLFRVLVVMQFLEQNEKGEYLQTRFSRAYAAVLGPGMLFRMTYDDCSSGLGQLHRYLSDRKSVTEPDCQSHNPFTWSRGQDGKTIWEIMPVNGGLDIALSAMDKWFPPTGFFDFGTLATTDERVVLVDVGGGVGRTLSAIIKSSPQLQKMAERFILQEMEYPAKQAESSGNLPEGVRIIVHSMFDAQPIKNARAYYLRRILHEYSDLKCVQILKNLAEAAAPDSKLLISEMVMPVHLGEGELPTICMDMSMMNMGGKERSEAHFAEILQTAGWSLVNAHKGFGTDRLLEAQLMGPCERLY